MEERAVGGMNLGRGKPLRGETLGIPRIWWKPSLVVPGSITKVQKCTKPWRRQILEEKTLEELPELAVCILQGLSVQGTDTGALHMFLFWVLSNGHGTVGSTACGGG